MKKVLLAGVALALAWGGSAQAVNFVVISFYGEVAYEGLEYETYTDPFPRQFSFVTAVSGQATIDLRASNGVLTSGSLFLIKAPEYVGIGLANYDFSQSSVGTELATTFGSSTSIGLCSTKNGLNCFGSVPIQRLSIIGYDEARAPTPFDFTVSRFRFLPEPTTWAMMIVGFGMVGAAARRPRRVVRLTL